MKQIGKMVLYALAVVGVLAGNSFGADSASGPTTNNGAKWRIGFYEGGEYIDYQKNLVSLVKGLMASGWIEETPIPEQSGEQTADLWKWLAENAKSRYLMFVKDAHYSANWDKASRKKVVAEILERLNSKKDINLMIASGTWAGLDLANNNHSTSTMVVSSSDPVAAGIVKSVENSGFDHVHATVQPYRYKMQLETFHDIVEFKRLGVAYHDSESGRSIAAMDKINDLKAKKGVEVLECHTIDDTPDKAASENSVKQCFQQLVNKGADAVYVTQQNGISKNSLPDIVKIFLESKTPSFSQAGSEEVAAGLLMSMSSANFSFHGEFYANVIASIFNGTPAGKMSQILNTPKKIAVNLKTADAIGFDFSPEILKHADEIFEDIAVP